MLNKKTKKALKMYAKFRDKLAMLERNYEIRNNTALTRLKIIRKLDTQVQMLTLENQRLKEALKGSHNVRQ